MKVSEMALRPLQRTLRMYSSACSTKRQFTGMRAEFAAIRCGVYTCQTRTMFSEWMYSRKNVDIVAPVYLKAYNYPESVAIVDHQGEHTYGNILYKSHLLSTKLLETADFRLSSDRMPARVCLLCPNNVSYVIAQWATWMSGGMVVPLCSTHPPSELRYFVEDSDCVVIVTTEDLAEKIEATASELNKVLLVLKQDEYSIEVQSGKHEDAKNEKSIPPIDTRQEQWKTMLLSNKYKRMPAMIIYTSGTTGRPKGVVHTHGSLAAQMDGMTQAWEWKSTDVILHTLPLHHIHGIVNVLMTPLYNGAKCIMLPKFNAEQVWDKLLNEVNLFMAVPTVYAKLIEYYEENYGSNDGNSNRILNYRSYIKHNLTVKVRLMVSGSAALPEPIMTKWEKITGHRLLERYGMTEIGMALTNPLRGPRMAGSVGQPFPGVEVAIGKPNAYIKAEYDIIAKGNQYSSTVTPGLENESGELLVRGPNVFVKYWQRPEATEKTLTSDGWFKTGDAARYSEGNYKILGRTSVDIIKSGGYKISALDIERHLLTHDDITVVAVIGLPDHMFGQRIAAVLVLKEGSSLKEDDLKTWCKDKMPKYQIPTVWEFLGNIPRNAMGKVNKKELAKQVFPKQLRGFL